MAKEDVAQAAEEKVDEVTEVEITEDVAPSIAGRILVDSLTATQSAIGAATVGELDASTSAIGSLSVAGDASFSTCATAIVSAKQNVDLRQGWASVVVAGGDVTLAQGGSALMIGRSMAMESAGSAAVVAGEANVSRGWVGILLAGKAEVADDSRVFINTRAAIIIAAALLGGLGFVALAMLYSSGRVARQWNPQAIVDWARHTPPAEFVERFRKAAAG